MKKLKAFNNFFLALSLISLCACTMAPKKARDPNRLFPDGLYTQNIQLKIQTENETKNLPFRSLSKIDNGKFAIVALTPFGTSAFKASGDLKDPQSVKLKFYIQLPSFMNEDFVKKTLFKIQGLQKLKKTDLIRKGDRDIYQEENLKLEIFSYNKQGLPKQMKVITPRWTAFINTESYK